MLILFNERDKSLSKSNFHRETARAQHRNYSQNLKLDWCIDRHGISIFHPVVCSFGNGRVDVLHQHHPYGGGCAEAQDSVDRGTIDTE